MKILTISSVFPNKNLPFTGLFVYERMKHVAAKTHVMVVAPVPWSPFDSIIRRFKKTFRPARAGKEIRGGLEVRYIRFFCLPGIFKFLDGYMYYKSIAKQVAGLIEKNNIDLIDVHFAYPDGFAAMLLAKKLGLPFCVTLRGTELPYSKSFYRRWQMRWVFKKSAKIISVSQSLSRLAVQTGASPEKIKIIPNGINTNIFYPRSRSRARELLCIERNATVILSVGGLVKRKGFHRIIRHLPQLQNSVNPILFLIVGGGSVEGDYSKELQAQVQDYHLESVVRFEGQQPPEKLPWYYSAADLFVLATANEGWPNVIVESLACGAPVVATDVGGVKEIITHDYLGFTVPFGDSVALYCAMEKGLKKKWDRDRITAYGQNRSWGNVADEVLAVFKEIAATDNQQEI